ncbi:MAG: family 1 glycosylhydrolase [Acidimicrobiales bacterium]
MPYEVAPRGNRPPRAAPGSRLTAMGHEYWPQVTEAAVGRAAALTGKPVVVTENRIATDDDAERVEYVIDALVGVPRYLADGIDVRCYFYRSLPDNFRFDARLPAARRAPVR